MILGEYPWSSRSSIWAKVMMMTISLSHDGVGLEAGAVIDIDDVDLLVFADIGQTQQYRVDGNRPGIVQIGIRNGGPMDLGFEDIAEHLPLIY
jgi:hypothetical protein